MRLQCSTLAVLSLEAMVMSLEAWRFVTVLLCSYTVCRYCPVWGSHVSSYNGNVLYASHGYTSTCMQQVVDNTEAKRDWTRAEQVNGGIIFMTQMLERLQKTNWSWGLSFLSATFSQGFQTDIQTPAAVVDSAQQCRSGSWSRTHGQQSDIGQRVPRLQL